MTTTRITRRDVERVVREARERGEAPHLAESDLRWVDLHGLDLTGAILYASNMRGAICTGTNLTGSNLAGVDMSSCDLHGANLTGAYMNGAAVSVARGIVNLGRTPSGAARMAPLPTGTWQLSVGCWDGATSELRALIAGDDWPDAEGAERDRRRPILAALADLADAQAAYHNDWLQAVVKRWGDKETTR